MIVIENFFDNPEEVIEMSKELNYHPEFQGLRSDCLTKTKHRDFAFECVKRVIKTYLGDKKVEIKDGSVLFHVGDPNYGHGAPHRDPGVSAIIYLNKTGVPGTSVFKQINDSPYNNRNERMEAIEKKDYDLYNKLASEYMTNFEKTVQVNGEYNRAVMFDESNLHASDGFGLDKDGGPRLTLLLFINDFEIIE